MPVLRPRLFGTTRFRHPGSLRAVKFAPDSRTVAAVSEDGSARLWDVASGEEKARVELRRKDLPDRLAQLHAVAFSPDGAFLYCGGEGGVWGWKLTPDQRLYEADKACLRLETRDVRALAVSADGRRVVCSCSLHVDEKGGQIVVDPAAAEVWDLKTKERLLKVEVDFPHFAGNPAWFPDGNQVAFAAQKEDCLRVYDVARGKETLRIDNKQDRLRPEVVVSPDGRWLAAPGERSCCVYAADGGKLRWALPSGTARVVTVTFTPDSKSVVAGMNDGTICFWSLVSGEATLRLKGRPTGFAALDVSPNGKTLAAAGEDAAVRLWDLATGKEIGAPEGHLDRVNGVALAPSGRVIASVGADGLFQLWDVGPGKRLRALAGDGEKMDRVVFSPDGASLVTGERGTLRVRDVATLEQKFVLRGAHPRSPYLGVYCRGGELLATYESFCLGPVSLRDPRTGQERFRLEPGKRIQDCAVSPSGEELTLSVPGGVEVWDLETRREVRAISFREDPLRGKRAPLAAEYSPDGRLLAVAGPYGDTVRVYEAATGKQFRELSRYAAWPSSAAAACWPGAPRREKCSSGTPAPVPSWTASTVPAAPP